METNEQSYILLRYQANEKPKKIFFSFKVKKFPVTIDMSVFDHTKPFTTFFWKQEDFISIDNRVDYEIDLPWTSKEISFCIYLKDQSQNIYDYIDILRLEIEDFKFTPYKFKPEVQSFINLAKEFNMQAGYLPVGMKYTSNDGKYEFRYLEHIPAKGGGIHPTPTRIAVPDGFIEKSQLHYKNATVYMRMAWDLHELAHNPEIRKNNPDPDKEEEEADAWALWAYEKLHLPRNQFVYAFSSIFKNYTEDQYQKLMQDQNFRNSHKKNVKRLEKVYDALK